MRTTVQRMQTGLNTAAKQLTKTFNQKPTKSQTKNTTERKGARLNQIELNQTELDTTEHKTN